MKLQHLPDPARIRREGRLVFQQKVHSNAGRTAVVPFSQATQAIYFVVVDAHMTDRLVPIR